MKPLALICCYPLRLAGILALGGTVSCLAGLEYPGPPPGSAQAAVTLPTLALSNRALTATWSLSDAALQSSRFDDALSGQLFHPTGEVFQVILTNGRHYPASALQPQAAPRSLPVRPREGSSRLADRLPGQQMEIPWRSDDGRLHVRWRALLRDGANYIRQELVLTAALEDLPIREISWLQESWPGATQSGTVDGSPLVAGPFFLGVEDPMAENQIRTPERSLGNWSPADLPSPQRHTKAWTIDPGWFVPGENQIVFRYARGPHRLDIWRVVLLQAGRELARDEHHGHTGTTHTDNTYRLTLHEPAASAPCKLVAELSTDPDFSLPAERAVESWGEVVLLSPTGQAMGRLPRNIVLPRGQSLSCSFVVGVAPAGQLRRAFLHYLEQERAHPFRPFLHYNSWYDIAWAPFALNETNCLEAIHLLGEHFLKPHSVVMDAMVFDDGWDNPQSLWQFHGGFPRGFGPLAEACRKYQTRLGVWLSPFGGYGEPKEQRLKFGRAQGFETNPTGFSLGGPKYYAAFKDACVDMIRKYGVNHFKFDGIAGGMYASGGADYVLDTEALRRLMLELREVDPDLYINFTTGSWPSPFWLRYADSLWRQGGDMGLAGVGSRQQQWLTYRDQETYRNIVRKGPLYPLNSLMTQGVAYSRHGSAGDPSFNSAGFKDDVQAFFASGTGLQELYIQPSKLTPQDWAVLAEAARWARAHADVLLDTHWIGGDPSRLQVYGYASWSPRRGILMLRNPADRAQSLALDLQTAFELPPAAPGHYRLRSPWTEHADQPARPATAGRPVTFTLRPFEILVLQADPQEEVAHDPN